jgi:hypothetical protein
MGAHLAKYNKSSSSTYKSALSPSGSSRYNKKASRSLKKKSRSPHPRNTSAVASPRFSRVNKNHECRGDLFSCIPDSNEIAGGPTIIGAGSFGIVAKYPLKNGKNLAIKFMFKTSVSDSSQSMIEMENELAYTYYMGNVGIGPRVISAFYYILSYEEIENNYPELVNIIEMIMDRYGDEIYPQFRPAVKMLEDGVPKDSIPVEIQCIVMDAYDMACDDALRSKHFDVYTKAAILEEMFKYIKLQVLEGIYCYDVKPGNFVVTVDNNVDVRMIDFGADFCTEGTIYNRYSNTSYVPHSNSSITFTQMLIVSNMLQIFFLMGGYPFLHRLKDDLERELIINEFYNVPEFKLFMSLDYRKIMTWYIEHAIKTHAMQIDDPSVNFIWYTSGVFSLRKDTYKPDNIQKLLTLVIQTLEVIEALYM